MSNNDNQPPKRICLGKIAGVHGVRGLVKFKPFADDISLFKNAKTIYRSKDGDETIKITLKNNAGKFILAEIEGITDRTEAESYKSTELYVDRDILPKLADDGGFYYEDLIGLKALDKDGNHIGKVINVDDFGAGDLLDVQPLSGQSYYVPFNDDYVLNTDIDSGTITITPLVIE